MDENKFLFYFYLDISLVIWLHLESNIVIQWKIYINIFDHFLKENNEIFFIIKNWEEFEKEWVF